MALGPPLSLACLQLLEPGLVGEEQADIRHEWSHEEIEIHSANRFVIQQDFKDATFKTKIDIHSILGSVKGHANTIIHEATFNPQNLSMRTG